MRRQSKDTEAMTALQIVQGSLLTASVATGLLATIVQYQIYRHLRRQHHKAFDRLGLPRPSFFWREDRQADSVAFDTYLSSESYRALEDRQLRVLSRRVRALRWMSGAGFALLLITLMVFWAGPNSLWDFLMDLGRY
jgi:hypothetical protein